jgi:hypothetical protein
VGQGLEPDEGASMPTSKAPSILDNIVQGFEAAKPIQTFFLSLAASMGIAKRAFTPVFDSLDRGFKTINKNADSKTILEGIANVLWFIGFLAGGVANGFSFLVGIIVSVLSIIASSIAWVIGVIIGLGSIIWEALSGIGQAIADGFVNGWDSFKTKSQDAAAKAINDLIDFFKSLLGISSPSTVFDEFGKDTIQGFIDGIVSRASDLIENFKALFIGPNGIITWALSEETRNEILAIGKNIVGSIQSGIEEKWEEFKSWLKKKIDALPDWLKEFLNMGSPSKIMMEIGRDTMAGFIIGFQEAGKGIEQMFADSALGADLMRNLTSPVSVPVNLRPALGSLSAFPDFGDGPYMVQVVLNDPVVREESDIKRLSKAVADELQKTSYKRVKFGGHINS